MAVRLRCAVPSGVCDRIRQQRNYEWFPSCCNVSGVVEVQGDTAFCAYLVAVSLSCESAMLAMRQRCVYGSWGEGATLLPQLFTLYFNHGNLPSIYAQSRRRAVTVLFDGLC